MRTLLSIIFFLISLNLFCQNEIIVNIDKDKSQSSDIFIKADTMPILKCQYKGDYLEKINQFVINNLKWPNNEIDCTGNVYVQFIIEKDGSISNIKILRGLDSCDGFNEEALRVVGLMKHWKPGIKNNEKVRVMLTIPIKFMI